MLSRIMRRLEVPLQNFRRASVAIRSAGDDARTAPLPGTPIKNPYTPEVCILFDSSPVVRGYIILFCLVTTGKIQPQLPYGRIQPCIPYV